MKASSTAFTVAMVVAKIAIVSLVTGLAISCWFIDQPAGMRRQEFQEARWLIIIAAITSSAAVLLLTRRNIVRVLINTPILLASTILGIVVALESAGSADDFVVPTWRLVLIGGSCGAFVGHVLLAIGWTFAQWLKRRGPDDRGLPTEMSIPAWRWETKGSDGG